LLCHIDAVEEVLGVFGSERFTGSHAAPAILQGLFGPTDAPLNFRQPLVRDGNVPARAGSGFGPPASL
jgi:hypothetical protein